MNTSLTIPKSVLYPALRFAGYILVVLAVIGIIMLDTHHPWEKRFSETSWIELTQHIFLLLSSLICAYVCRGRTFRNTAILLLGFLTASFIRESDGFLDDFLFHGSWTLFVTPVCATVILLTWRNRLKFYDEMQTFLPSLSCGLFMGGFFTTYVFSRFIGRRFVWETILGGDYVRAVKRFTEESVELLGYTFLLFAAIELFLMARKGKTSKSSP